MPRKRLPTDVIARVRRDARNRCGYCLSPQHLVLGPLHVEHITPLAAGGSDDEDNLWLSCAVCNGHKSDKTSATDPDTNVEYQLFNPRTQDWPDHFRWSDDGLRIIGVTPVGRATVSALQLDSDPIAIAVRAAWVSADWHPPDS